MCVGRRDRICIDLRQKQDVKRYSTKWRRSDLCPRAVNLFTQFLFESRFYHALSATSELMPSKQRRNTIYPELCLQPYILRQQLHPHIPRHPPSHKTHEKKQQHRNAIKQKQVCRKFISDLQFSCVINMATSDQRLFKAVRQLPFPLLWKFMFFLCFWR